MGTPSWEIAKALQEEKNFTVNGKDCYIRSSDHSVFVAYGNRRYEYGNKPEAIHAKVFGGKSIFELWDRISEQF